MEGILDRIKQIMANEGVSPSALADTIGIGRPLLSHVLSGRNNPSLQVVLKILEFYPSYSANWLLTGKEDAVQSREPVPVPDLNLFSEIPVNNLEKKTEMPAAKQKSISPDGLPEVVLMMFEDKTYEAYKLRK